MKAVRIAGAIVTVLALGTAAVAVAIARSDQVEVVAASTGGALPDAAVLFHGIGNGTCQRFVVVEAAKTLPWTDPAGDPACALSVTGFAPGFAPGVMLDPPDRTAAWRIALKPALEVAVHRWVIREHDSDDLGLVDQVLPAANGTLHGGRAGFALADDGRTDLARGSAEAAVIGYGCGQVEAIRASPELFAPGKLNVYFVSFIMVPDTISGVPVGNRLTVAQGVNCGASGAPDMIFLSYQLGGAAILEHELGHAMGFWEPNGGHADPATPGMEANIMQDGGVSGGGDITLGQAYRMQFHSGSWLQIAGLADATHQVDCQDDRTSDDPCPRFSRGSEP